MTDTIITISPGEAGHLDAVQAIRKSKLYHPAMPNDAPPEQRSPSPDSDRTELMDEEDFPQLRIRLEDILSSPTGITIGTDSSCHIPIPKGCSVSARHCTILFNARNHLVARDGGSMNGTMISYNMQSSGRRKNYESILWPLPLGENNQVVQVTMRCGKPSFTIKATGFALTDDHERQIRNWRSGDTSTHDILEGLNMPPDQFTQVQTASAKTPSDIDYCIERHVGHGAFGSVTYMFNTRTGDEMVKKEPVNGKKFNPDDWQREGELLAQCSHDHIVKLFDRKLSPVPQLYLEYMRCGTLNEASNLSLREKQLVLVQCLSALEYLHGEGKNIGHRDIKPENILVHDRSNGNICVKFGDFGLAKAERDSTMLRSRVGTRHYMAPEIVGAYFRGIVKEYSVKVDVWSLGLVIHGLLCSSPRLLTNFEGFGHKYCTLVVSNLENEIECAEKAHTKTAEQCQELEIKRFLLEHMLVVDDEKRSSAADCMKAALSLNGMPQPGCFCRPLSVGSSDAMANINGRSALIASTSACESATEDSANSDSRTGASAGWYFLNATGSYC
ncbi:unnamed protein product [Clonostachys rosea f. rosea IK726]|uniref:Uncharacterized protein n=1 Tax=Clonostachys rosea f. rosea IK726 TaxID=1349383 RepID=A0ACA9TNJ2_BIOOC|nr:unnamed protein product [Clonostachys rosea f. rosea IK726]